MSSFKAKLKIAGKEVNIRHCSYALKQETDATGRPSAITRGGKIYIRVESTGDTMFFEWMANNFERKNGSIVYTRRDNNATLKELKFTEAYMIDYREIFNSTNQNPIIETFTLSARGICMGNGIHLNEWIK